MLDIGLISYSLGAVLFFVLTMLLLTAWRGHLQGGLLVSASVLSLLWCAGLAYYSAFGVPSMRVLAVLEIARDASWFLFLLKALGYAKQQAGDSKGSLRILAVAVGSLCAILMALVVVWPGAQLALFPAGARFDSSIFGFVLLSVTGLALVEQLFRNTRVEYRWTIKFLCLSVGGIFAYDFFLYSVALLFNQVDAGLWAARGAVNALVVPFLAAAAARNPQWSLEIFVSRHIVFHTAALLGAGSYLILMAGAGYYIRIYGGSWGTFAQSIFLFGALMVLLLLMFSGQLRSRGKVFLSKHFYKNRYDYRDEWLKFTQTLSAKARNSELRENIVKAIAQIVESTGGVMWMRGPSGFFHPVSHWNMTLPESANESENSSLVRFLQRRGWVIYLDEIEDNPEEYGSLDLPDWLGSLERAWIILPLMQSEDLLGFLVISRSMTKSKLNWEDGDLLKTVGRQAASYLALMTATEALAESRQFDAFNRLSSFVVHDLKNLVAQLSLVGSNAKKHMHNPAFIEDAINTVENATAKMNRLLGQLRKGRLEETTSKLVNLRPVLRKVINARSVRKPVPQLKCLSDGAIIKADPDRLASVLEHLVQNAQEATPPDGRVEIRLSRTSNWVVIEVQDSGCGMDDQFVAERLFRPFDTTKGNAGMGIGVYEAREFVTSRGGDIEVTSEIGKGTTFRIRFPIGNGEVHPVGDEIPTEVLT